MSIHENGGCLLTHLFDRDLDRMKGILEDRLHESSTLHVDHADRPLRGVEHDRATAGCTVGIIHRAQQAWLRVDEANDVLLVPDVIATRYHGNARAQEIDGYFRRDSPPARG